MWFGERTKFTGIKNYGDYSPSNRIIEENEVFILDVAPVYKGYTSDIGYTGVLGSNPDFTTAESDLLWFYDEMPKLFKKAQTPSQLWHNIDEKITKLGYENIHKKYPFGVLGHRVHRVKSILPQMHVFNFSLKAYSQFTKLGLFSQLLNQDYCGPLQGLWAIEPHLATESFGFKFEHLYLHSDGYSGLSLIHISEPTRPY